jgi:glutathione S-transferase
MRQLHHFPLSPFCRRVRLVLAEKKLTFDAHAERPWEPKDELFPLDPAKQLPVLIEAGGGAKLSDAQAISEYLEELHPDPPLLPKRPGERAEVRRLCAWFDRFFFGEIGSVVVREKYLKRFRQTPTPEPDLASLRRALEASRRHLAFIEKLIDERDCLAGALSLADFTAAAHISCVDYFGDVPWDAYPKARDWYARLKSRPSFRPLLADSVPGLTPPPHYANLDF